MKEIKYKISNDIYKVEVTLKEAITAGITGGYTYYKIYINDEYIGFGWDEEDARIFAERYQHNL